MLVVGTTSLTAQEEEKAIQQTPVMIIRVVAISLKMAIHPEPGSAGGFFC
ncbi:hypothetical protein EXN66_Car022142 [Channa argus]|uniref:Uncharacterized protein n=1 Tax=Channa argus TaxID=215402 RepID=A0A6G1QUR5_CHAAH|nr:hypothetical protein EXN66_Car022142 [Channa argus]